MELAITKFSPAHADRLFDASPTLERIASGYQFSEGPVWDATDNRLYFTDFRSCLIYRWTEKGGASVYRERSGRAIGLAICHDGRLVAAESYSRGVAFTGETGSEMIADRCGGKRFSSPNDLCVTKNGDICFTDPFSTALGRPREADCNGVYRVTPGGEARLLYAETPHPNGLAFSPDETVFYVNDTSRQEILAFDVRADGSVSLRGVFARTDPSFGPGAPDGMKTDILGNVYVTGPGGIWVFAPDAAPVALLHMPEPAGNFCFGGPGGEELYVTASSSVYRARVKVGGALPERRER